ncbi:hypothetical protein CCACVL1_19803 [Corchorus capsularis]|uniref:Uncharacterized protein n=1 Tax=Corchorus capsularis TaxID=210143 RepID=A0A1R3HF16_COCAP|nr:hypothetical protein CCACVL1_19803 [Corchorus capsularis]
MAVSSKSGIKSFNCRIFCTRNRLAEPSPVISRSDKKELVKKFLHIERDGSGGKVA